MDKQNNINIMENKFADAAAYYKKTSFLTGDAPRLMIILNAAMATIYFASLAFWFPRGNVYLFGLLVAGEVYHLWQVLTYLYTTWDTSHVAAQEPGYAPSVDVYITVAGEPVSVVEKTVVAAKAMEYRDFKIYILNDGYVAGKDNWRDMEALAARHGIGCVTRKVAGGAKAGNINHAVGVTLAPFVAIFDADHVPHPDFLQKMMPHFADPKMAFAQSPQYYANYAENDITDAAWEQEKLWFGPILRGKNRLNSASMCGTNMVIRRLALEEVGGMCEDNIAEDFMTSFFMHERGWKSAYVPEVLAEGLAPEDMLSYYKQQHRWARGSLEVIFFFNPIFRKGLTWAQKIQYISSASYYLSGAVVLMNAMLPLLFLYFGISPLNISTMTLAGIFLPYIFVTLYVLQLSSNFTFSFRALAFSMSAFPIHLSAMWQVITKQKTAFAVTSKNRLDGSFAYLAFPHMAYVAAAVLGIALAVFREGIDPSVITNVAWVSINVAVFMPFILATRPQSAKAAAAISQPAGARQPQRARAAIAARN